MFFAVLISLKTTTAYNCDRFAIDLAIAIFALCFLLNIP